MELGLSLGDASIPKQFGMAEKSRKVKSNGNGNKKLSLGFCMGLGIGSSFNVVEQEHDKSTRKEVVDDEDQSDDESTEADEDDDNDAAAENGNTNNTAPNPNLIQQLDLLPLVPVPRSNPFPNCPPNSDHHGSPVHLGLPTTTRGFDFDVNRLPTVSAAAEERETEEGRVMSSSSPPNSVASSFRMDFCMFRSSSAATGGNNNNKRSSDDSAAMDGERASSRASDEDDNGLTRKKLRLSKEQSAFLEESFKEHNTLTPKQKLALAKQLNLRPRQVEVWFQNRRARTKLKQTEVDCEYLKRCCETLTEENRRLHKELQELRALKTTSSNPFLMQLPATTLTMCPSCERVATTTTSSSTAAPTTTSASAVAPTPFSFSTRPRFYPFSHTQSHPHPHPHQSAAS
ncbi:Leucine zipper, homeobox-associated [Dillenia turbinata]|uniref:Leucine zipper, homeobox-associated n=1 Tax=Dillenia turbinata TaxID=194707 RepID=A0AAN8ZGL6_9MAGN